MLENLKINVDRVNNNEYTKKVDRVNKNKELYWSGKPYEK